MDKKNILDLTLDELKDYFVENGEKNYRAQQIYSWLYKGVRDLDRMNNVPKKIRDNLKENFSFHLLELIKRYVSKIDGTRKYLYKLFDNNIIECVFMKYKHGNSICISTQVGCKMGCAFCASGKAGFIRNLSPGEIMDQILMTINDTGEKISNIVIMGIGEPFDNYDNLLVFLRNINNKFGLNIGYRHISVSTCGLVDKIYKFLEEKLPVTLSISLHSADDKTRKEIMPITNKFSVDEVLKACRIYTKTLKRRVTFEYTLISGVNDTGSDALKLAKKIKGMLCHVNLIMVNEIGQKDIKRSSGQVCESFKKVLLRNGIETTVRRELGNDINAACGQLRRNLEEVCALGVI